MEDTNLRGGNDCSPTEVMKFSLVVIDLQKLSAEARNVLSMEPIKEENRLN
jgi:hypothetical protein